MDAKINIAKILKDKPQGTRLYSSACGKCELKEADDKSFKVSFYSSKFGFMNGGEGTFDKNGNLYDDGECVIFPSKEMRDWSKFAWKKGDVLVSNDSDSHIIFKGFSKNDYTTFEGKHWISVSKKRHVSCLQMQDVQDYHIEDNKDSGQTYINAIEERLGGKLNRETLEVEKSQPVFKDGDILYATNLINGYIYINKEPKKNIDICYCYRLSGEGYLHICDLENSYDCTLPSCSIIKEKTRFATEEEKQQLFDALAKENKAWNSEKKQIVDLPKKCEFKAFDKVLVRMRQNNVWKMAFFIEESKDKSDASYPYRAFNIEEAINDLYAECIPYNEDTKHLLGTTDEWKGGGEG